MGEIVTPEYMDLGGGLDEGVAPHSILDTEMQVLENLFPFARKLIRRGGTTRLTNAAYSEDITGITSFKPSSDSLTTDIIVGTLTGLAKLDSETLIPLVNRDGSALLSDDHLWTLFQYNNVGFAFRRNSGLRRFTNEVHSAAGIAGPSSAPVLAQGAAGALTAASYQGVVTFVNTATEAESNPSSISNTLALAAGKKIDWSAIPVSGSYQTNARRLYRTLPDQQGNYLFVAQLNDNTTTVYSDNVEIADLGDFASFNNDQPPPGLEIADTFNERSFASDGIDLFFTEAFLPESWAADNILRITPDDGHRMSAVHADGARLIVGKTNKVHALTGTDRSNFSVETISDRHGVYSHHSMKSAEGQLLWYGGNSFYRIYGGGQPESIASVKLKRTLERIPDDRKEYVVSAVYPKWGWYLSAVTLDDNPRNNTVLCYNYKSDAWCTFKFPDDAPAVFGEVFDSDLAQIIYCAFYDKFLNQSESGLQDFGNQIVSKFRTKSWRGNSGGLQCALLRFFIHITTVAAVATFRVFRDGATTAIKTRTGVSLYRAENPKGFDFSTLGSPSSSFALEMEYSGTPHVEIEGLALELVKVNRRTKSY